jgi:hypothetical protein
MVKIHKTDNLVPYRKEEKRRSVLSDKNLLPMVCISAKP